MITKHKMQELQELAAERGPLCVGLDTDPSYLPDSVIKAVGSAEEAVLAYNKEIIRRIAAAALKFRLHITKQWDLKA